MWAMWGMDGGQSGDRREAESPFRKWSSER